jgi:hypothetical protein
MLKLGGDLVPSNLFPPHLQVSANFFCPEGLYPLAAFFHRATMSVSSFLKLLHTNVPTDSIYVAIVESRPASAIFVAYQSDEAAPITTMEATLELPG